MYGHQTVRDDKSRDRFASVMRAWFNAQSSTRAFNKKHANQISFVTSLLSTVSSEFYPRVMGNQMAQMRVVIQQLPDLYSVVTDLALAKRQYSAPTARLRDRLTGSWGSPHQIHSSQPSGNSGVARG